MNRIQLFIFIIFTVFSLRAMELSEFPLAQAPLIENVYVEPESTLKDLCTLVVHNDRQLNKRKYTNVSVNNMIDEFIVEFCKKRANNSTDQCFKAIEIKAPKSVVSYFINAGANISAMIYPYIGLTSPYSLEILNLPMYAAKIGHKEAIDAFLESKKGNMHLVNNTGNTLLTYASQSADAETVKRLVEDVPGVITKYNVPARNRSFEKALLNVDKGDDDNRKKIVRTLVRKGAKINTQNNEGKTLLIKAAEKGDKTLAQIALDSGADKTIKDKNKKTAIDYARQHEYFDVITVLNKPTIKKQNKHIGQDLNKENPKPLDSKVTDPVTGLMLELSKEGQTNIATHSQRTVTLVPHNANLRSRNGSAPQRMLKEVVNKNKEN